MATFVWVAVFMLLLVEIGVLVLFSFQPTARVLVQALEKNGLTGRIKGVLRFIIFGLVIGLWDSITTVQRMNSKEAAMGIGAKSGTGMLDAASFVHYSQDRPRKFRAERNVYLSAFCLALLWLIRVLFFLTKVMIEKDELIARLQKAPPQAISPHGQVDESTSANETASRSQDNVSDPPTHDQAIEPVDPVHEESEEPVPISLNEHERVRSAHSDRARSDTAALRHRKPMPA
ncbi:hypothetical protein FVE85_5127 [Porphyridium purpureum]|uniref:Endoplasmic reticulum transmembrane protein n=1 Tax=Porphyridium purpureum TaxID=35688 RepID=A0A5J4Z2Y8_PORPP|nr:hypothetical protein FVE85_5127 [Porphyridium purpureum]|eukprot:POR9264..scf295_1